MFECLKVLFHVVLAETVARVSKDFERYVMLACWTAASVGSRSVKKGIWWQLKREERHLVEEMHMVTAEA